MKDVSSQLYLTAVPQPVLDVVWPQAKELLNMAVVATNGVYDLDSVHRGLLSGEYVLWLVMDDATPIAALTTRICEYPQCRGLALDWIGGKRMAEWLPMAQDVMSNYARENGCTHLEGYGRKAWGRWLQKYGWEPAYIAFKMELTDG